MSGMEELTVPGHKLTKTGVFVNYNIIICYCIKMKGELGLLKHQKDKSYRTPFKNYVVCI